MGDNKPVPIKGRKSLKYRSSECLNCGQPLDLSDRYCSYCSQLNTTKSLSLKDFIGEFMGSIITYDSRFRYTLKDLLFKPGTITRKYVEGKRLRYANPFRFFLSVSIIFFLAQSLIGLISGTNNLLDNVQVNGDPLVMDSSLEEGAKSLESLTDSIEKNMGKELSGLELKELLKKNKVGDQADIEKLDSLLSANNLEITSKNADSILREFRSIPFITGNTDEDLSYEPISETALDTMSWAERSFKRAWLYHKFYQSTGIEDPVVALDSLKHVNNSANRWIYSKNEALERIKNNPAAFLEYLLSKTPFFLFFFTPFFALFFWLLYYYKKYTYMEHMIFIFHVFSFVFLAGLICLIPDTLLGADILFGIVMSLVGPFYFYKALRNFYQENRFVTVIKFVLLNSFFVIGASIGALIFFSLTAALY
jgi:hypothetical protein